MDEATLNALKCMQNDTVYDFSLSGRNTWFEAIWVEPHVSHGAAQGLCVKDMQRFRAQLLLSLVHARTEMDECRWMPLVLLLRTTQNTSISAHTNTHVLEHVPGNIHVIESLTASNRTLASPLGRSCIFRFLVLHASMPPRNVGVGVA